LGLAVNKLEHGPLDGYVSLPATVCVSLAFRKVRRVVDLRWGRVMVKAGARGSGKGEVNLSPSVRLVVDEAPLPSGEAMEAVEKTHAEALPLPPEPPSFVASTYSAVGVGVTIALQCGWGWGYPWSIASSRGRGTAPWTTFLCR